MQRTEIINSNPRSAIVAWEVSLCLELPDHEGGTYIEAFATAAEAAEQSDESVDGVFWGVYARLNEDAIQEGYPPAIYMRDFGGYEEAMRFVQLLNGETDDE